MSTEKNIWDLLASLDYRIDQRLPPDSVRQGAFLSGWTKAIDEERSEYAPATLQKLTWDNLGYRMGLHLGALSKDERLQVYHHCSEHWYHSKIRAWLVITTDDPELLGEGYEDILGQIYSWDDKVANHSYLQAGDALVLWDRQQLLGYGIINNIETSVGEKTTYHCPICKKSGLQTRKTTEAPYYCPPRKSPVQEPGTRKINVQRYRANYAETWVDLSGELCGAELRRLCEKPKSQHSLRPLKWREFLNALSSDVRPVVQKNQRIGSSDIEGGHHQQTVRVRKGQSRFRAQLLTKYGEVCAFSGPTTRHALDAAHLYSYASVSEHHSCGGMLIRKDLHRLFDLGLLRVDPDALVIHIHEEIRDIPAYGDLHGERLAIEIPRRACEWLRVHWESYPPSNSLYTSEEGM